MFRNAAPIGVCILVARSPSFSAAVISERRSVRALSKPGLTAWLILDTQQPSENKSMNVFE